MTSNRIENVAALLVLLALTLATYWTYFDFSKDISRVAVAPGEFHTDLTPQFGPSSILWGEALERGSVAHWNPYILSGTPNLANPQSRFISVENALNFVLRGQLSARLSIPIQILIGCLGIFLLIRALGFGSAYGIALGAIYLFNPTYVGFHVATGHLNIVNGITLAPWLAYLTVRPFGRALLRPVSLGVVLALMIHGGASTILLYSCAALFPAYAVFRGQRDGLASALSDLAIVTAVTLGASWLKIAPAIDFMQISDRQHGMSTAMAFIRDAPFALGESPVLLTAIALLTAAGAVVLYGISRTWFWLAALSTALGAAFVTYEPVFAFVREHLPVLRSLRIPSRLLFLLYLEVGLLVCLGLRWIASLLASWNAGVARAVPWLAALVLAGGAYWLAPTPPTMVDLEARREANPILRHARGDGTFFRLTSFHDRDRHWGYQHQTIPYGIRTFLGYTATHAGDFIHSHYTASVGAAQHAFVPRVFENYATMTGLLSVKYVSAMEPVEEPGLQLIERFALSYGPQPPKSRGPYLYLNERAMPRAYYGTDVVALSGPEASTKRTVLDMLADTRFRPGSVTLVAAPDETSEAKLAIEKASWLLAPEHTPGELPRARSQETLLGASAASKRIALPVEEPSPEELRIALPDDVSGSWVVLSEKLAMFDGWSARIEGSTAFADLPLFRANYVNTAIWIPDGARGTLVLSYRSPGFAIGTLALFVTLAAVVLAAVFAPARQP